MRDSSEMIGQGTNPPSSSLPVAVDVMGGDHGSAVVVEGALQAAQNFSISSILVGKEDEIHSSLKRLGAANHPLMQVYHAPDIVEMEDSPTTALRKPHSSIRYAFQLVKDGKASSVVSPGNTGAMMAAGVFVSGTLPGITRPAIASLIPKTGKGPTVLLDSGANIDCHAYQFVQFAIMGALYARVAINAENPRVGLLSNGSEPSKGTDIIRAAALTLTEMPDLNFVGYVEARDLARDAVDVVVTDGFVGNVLLKTMEGTAELVMDSVKLAVEKSIIGKFGLLLARPSIRRLFREKLDPSSYGGAPLLGLNHVAIVCHGSAKARAIMNGIRVAQNVVDSDVVKKMEESLSLFDSQIPGSFEDGVWIRMGQRPEKRKGKDSLERSSAAGERGKNT